MTLKLLVWEKDTGAISISQYGATGKNVIERYEAHGNKAAFFEQEIPSLENVFIHHGKIKERPHMLARFHKTKVDQYGRGRIRADGQDEAQIIGVKAGSHVHITDGQKEDVIPSASGEILHFAIAIPSRWIISVDCPPYHQQWFELVAE